MPGVVFVIVVPTANFEQDLLNDPPAAIASNLHHTIGGNNLNINLPDNNAVLRLEVELRDKHARRRPNNRHKGFAGDGRNRPASPLSGGAHQMPPNPNNFFIPMEKVLDELLTKLEIEHVTWNSDKKGFYYTIIFPLESGEPTETTLHCCTALGIGLKSGSSVSVIPCTVSFDAIKQSNFEDEVRDAEADSKWNQFVESIKSKLTVKQVVDGVRSGGQLSFDYLLLIVTADSLAALGLIENNSSNIVAAMLVSPLMGPVMSITFGTMISDYKLVKSGFVALGAGMLISLIFGFIFGLIVGTTEQPWGSTDWPTEEMKARGNARSLWMALPWALTSGSGVALALMLGANGPLIGVAISASLLPPVVNCGLYWALACTWLIHRDRGQYVKIPHIKGESFTGNSSYVPLYTDYLPSEFAINGIVSCMLTVVNIMCIFITAIIVLKIKEVSAPYTSSPDLRRFWETDIKIVRESNRSTIRRKHGNVNMGAASRPTLDNILETDPQNGTALEQAIKEAVDDETFRKVKRMSYSGGSAGEITKRLGLSSNGNGNGDNGASTAAVIRNSKINADLNVLDQLVSSLLERQKQSSPSAASGDRESTKLSRLKSLSFRNRRSSNKGTPSTANELNLFSSSNATNGNSNAFIQAATAMPTILESNSGNMMMPLTQPPSQPQQSSSTINSSSLDRRHGSSGVRQIINTIKNAPHRLSQGMSIDHHRLNDEESSNLTRNMLD